MGIAVVALAGIAWWTSRLYTGAHTEIIIQSEFSWDQVRDFAFVARGV